MTTNVKGAVEQRSKTFYETQILPVGWQVYNLNS